MLNLAHIVSDEASKTEKIHPRGWLQGMREVFTHPTPPMRQESSALIDALPMATLRACFPPLAQEMQVLRDQGITDLMTHLLAHPELGRAWAGRVQLLQANRLALDFVGCSSLEELRSHWSDSPVDPLRQIFQDLLRGLWEGHLLVESEDSFLDAKKQPRSYLMRASLSEDGSDLIITLLDTSNTRRAAGRRIDQMDVVRDIIARANVLLWWAKVHRQGAHFRWRMNTPQQATLAPIYQLATAVSVGGLWDMSQIPEADEISALAEKSMLEDRPSYEHEFHVVQNGKAHSISENVVIQRLSENEWSLAGVAIDVTQIREAEEDLAAQKERLTVTLQAMTEGVITIGSTGAVEFINRAACTLLGVEAQEVTGHPLVSVVSFVDTKRESPWVPSEEIVTGKAGLVELPEDLSLTPKEGGSRRIKGCLAPVQDATGQTRGAVLVLRDVTERLKLEEHLHQASKLESVGLLAGGIAHDFNNILTAVLGNITLARADTGKMTETDRCLDEAHRATLRARDLSQMLITFAKGGNPVRSVLRLQELIAEAARFCLHGSNVRHELDLAPELWAVHADRAQISQVIHNLVTNAKEAMPAGGVVRIRADNHRAVPGNEEGLTPGDYVQIDVLDSGAGIPREQLPHVFELYFTTKANSHGLGLPTVFSILSKHEGKIVVLSGETGGCTLRFWLPAVHEESATKPQVARQPAPAAANAGKILFMDDEEPIITLARKMVKRLGLELDAAHDGAEALVLYQKAWDAGTPYRFVVMDLTIPGGMGGKETLSRLKQINPKVKTVVSSGYSSDQVMADYKAHGFDAMIAKPYELREVLAILSQMLEEN